MRVIQTFWSGNKNVAEDSFGWLSPKYHLEGWALSMLRLKKFYEQVELYTDKEGHKILVDKLQLPYTNVHIVYDDMNYPPELWAIPKILTYAKQKKPFIHIDGDVFIWEKFSDQLIKSNLVVQNLEIATNFYENFCNRIFPTLAFKPHYLRYVVPKEVCACNFGIFGGNDIHFIQKYAKEVLIFVNNNHQNISIENLHSFNVIYEQILFYDFARENKKNVNCLIDNPIEDFGYSYDLMADFTQVPYKKNYLHLIGGNKKNKTACMLMEMTLLKEFPYHHNLINKLLYEKRNNNDATAIYNKIAPVLFTDNSYTKNLIKILGYDIDSIIDNTVENATHNNLINNCKIFDNKLKQHNDSILQLSTEVIIQRDTLITDYFRFLHEDIDFQLKCFLVSDPLICFIDTVYDWTKIEGMSLEEIEKIETENNFYFAFVPERENYNIVPLEDLDCAILNTLEEKKLYKDLLREMKKCFNQNDIQHNYHNFLKLILIKIKFLITNKLIRISFP